MFYVFSFIVGAAIGSFFGVVLSRVVPDAQEHMTVRKAVSGRSRCAHCKRTLAWYELVPVVSFFALRGKCRSCRTPIPFQDLFVELVTGSVFALIAWRFVGLFPLHSAFDPLIPVWWVCVLIGAWWCIAALCILIAFYDARYFLIPNVLLYALIVFAIGMDILYWAYLRFIPAFPDAGILFSGTMGYLFGGSAFSLARILEGVGWAVALIGGAYLVSRGKGMGFGDVLIALAFGILFGWPDVMMVLFVAFVLGTLVSVALLSVKKKTMKSLVPFGPFLMLGALTTMIFGVTLTAVYLKIFPGLLL